MESAYSFIKITLLGLILGILVVLLLQINDFANTIKMSSRPLTVNRDKESRQEILEENKRLPPVYRLPNTPTHVI